MSRRVTVRRVLITVYVLLITTTLVGQISKTLYQRAEVRVPTYPNATNLRTTSEPYGPVGAGFSMRTTFETTDSPEAVIDFYRARLDVRGLQHWNFYPGLDGLALFNRDGCPSHALTMQPTRTGSGSTVVEINHSAITRC